MQAPNAVNALRPSSRRAWVSGWHHGGPRSRCSLFASYSNARLVSSRASRRPVTQNANVSCVPLEHRASYASLASSTAIGAQPVQHGIPQAFAPLHTALKALQHIIPEHVGIARLELALISLETAKPVVRVGLLGLGDDGFRQAKRLARLLIADPLGSEDATEKTLGEPSAVDSRPILIRLGETEHAMQTQLQGGSSLSLVNELSTASRLLQRHEIELLVAPVAFDTSRTSEVGNDSFANAALVPVLQSHRAGSGRPGFVRYPVHQAIVLAAGVGSALDLAALQNSQTVPAPLIHFLTDVPPAIGRLLENITTINIELAEQGLTALRMDVSAAPAFNRAWQEGGIGDVAASLPPSHSTDPSSPQLKPVLKAYLQNLLSDTTASLSAIELDHRHERADQDVPDAVRESLQDVITKWSDYGHSDLRHSLALAYASRTWQRTSFPRLLWRVDDVTSSATELLHSRFLQETETFLAFVTGRIGQAGFFEDTPAKTGVPKSAAKASTTKPDLTASTFFTPTESSSIEAVNAIFAPSKASLLRSGQVGSRFGYEAGLDANAAKPWPQDIDATRRSLITRLVPALHARAQALVLQCFGTIGGTSALAAWYVAATAGVGVYEAGAVASLGLVWALRRLQKKWNQARSTFEEEVAEQGRVVLGDLETTLRAIVRDNKRPQVVTEDQARLDTARDAIETCRAELEKL